MNTKQEFTPKYWAFHSIHSDDIYPATLAKSLTSAQVLAKRFYPVEFEQWENETLDGYRFSLIKINLVESGLEHKDGDKQ